MITVASTVGKLVEVRIQTPISTAEIVEMKAGVVASVQRLRGEFIGITDLRAATVFPMDLANQITNFMTAASPGLVRSGFIIGDGAVFNMQLDRVLREAGRGRRRAFRARADLEQWLADALTPEEQRRVAAFLDEGEPARR
jgi:hypothetical protein